MSPPFVGRELSSLAAVARLAANFRIACGVFFIGLSSCFAQCSLRQIQEGKLSPWILENDLVKLRLLPEIEGTIEDFRLKSNNLVTLYPYRETREEVVPGTGVYAISKTTFCGCRNAIWREGLTEFRAPHTFTVLEQTQEQVRALLEVRTSRWQLEREIILRKGESALDLIVRLTNTNDQTTEKSYWFQCLLRLADTLLSMPGDDSELLLAPGRQESAVVQGVTLPMKEARIVHRNPGDGKNMFLAPAQPWMTAADRTEKLVFGVCFDTANFPGDMVFYSWPGDQVHYSLEAFFPTTRYEPTKAVEHRMRIMVLSGLPDVHLLRPGYALYVAKSPGKGDGKQTPLDFKLAVLSPKAGSEVRLSLILTQGETKALSAPISFRELSPEKPVYADVQIPAEKLEPGSYELWVSEVGGGEFQLLGQGVEIR